MEALFSKYETLLERKDEHESARETEKKIKLSLEEDNSEREFEEGVLRIEFYQPEACDSAKTVLEEHSYTVHLPKN